MRKVDEDIDQIPMPYGITIWVSPSLDPLIIAIPTSHVMAHKQSGPIGQRRRPRLESNRGFVKRVVEGLEVGPGFELFEGFDRVRDWNVGSGRVEWRRVWRGGSVGVGLGHFEEEEKGSGFEGN